MGVVASVSSRGTVGAITVGVGMLAVIAVLRSLAGTSIRPFVGAFRLQLTASWRLDERITVIVVSKLFKGNFRSKVSGPKTLLKNYHIQVPGPSWLQRISARIKDHDHVRDALISSIHTLSMISPQGKLSFQTTLSHSTLSENASPNTGGIVRRAELGQKGAHK